MGTWLMDQGHPVLRDPCFSPLSRSCSLCPSWTLASTTEKELGLVVL